jgi:AcrR family transcriptional regulator
VPRGDTRARLLDAASAVIRRDGPQALTLDAVAGEAGVSKGGLLYHFRSKRELLDALVARWLDEFQDDIDAQPGGFARRYVAASDGAKAEEAGLLAALVADPQVLATVRDRHQAW